MMTKVKWPKRNSHICFQITCSYTVNIRLSGSVIFQLDRRNYVTCRHRWCLQYAVYRQYHLKYLIC